MDSAEYLKLRKRADRMGRFSLGMALLWAVNMGIAVYFGNLWGFAYIGVVVTFLALYVNQVKHIRYWWRPLRPIYISLLPADIMDWYDTGYKQDAEIAEWAKKRYGYDVFCHDLGIYSFRKKKHAMAFKLKWGGK